MTLPEVGHPLDKVKVMPFQRMIRSKTIAVPVAPRLLLALGLLLLADCTVLPAATPEPAPNEERGQFSTGCNDIVDISILPQDKKTKP